jgi:hypothetical protein
MRVKPRLQRTTASGKGTMIEIALRYLSLILAIYVGLNAAGCSVIAIKAIWRKQVLVFYPPLLSNVPLEPFASTCWMWSLTFALLGFFFHRVYR